jgi:hypothetical protein
MPKIAIDVKEFHYRVARTLAEVVMDIRDRPENAAMMPDTPEQLLDSVHSVVMIGMVEAYIKKHSTEPHEAPAISDDVKQMLERLNKL